MAATFLVRVSGPDRPGITAGLMNVLAADRVDIYDVEQVVVRGRLDLGLVINVPEGRATIKDLLFFGWQNGLQLDFEVVDAVTDEVPSTRSVVTVLGASVGPEAFGAVAGAIAGAGGNIERIGRLSRYPVVSYELAVRGGDVTAMRAELLAASAAAGVDVAIQEEGIGRRAKRLVVLDVDSTLIQDEVIDLLAAEAGVEAEVAAATQRAMTGDIDFASALRARVGLLAGLDADAIERVRRRIRFTPGARTFIRTLRRLGMKVGIVSGGFTLFTDALKADLDLDHAVANHLEVVDGRLTGRVMGDIIDRQAKAVALRDMAAVEGIPLDQTVAVGDGANDLDMLAVAGLGIAFNAKPVVRAAADTSVSVPYLDAILFLLGIKRDEVEAGEPVPIDGLPPI